MNTPMHYDALEARDPALREASLMEALACQVAHAQAHSPAQAKRLAGIDAADVRSRAALARLPVLRKSELLAEQASQRGEGDPFAGYAACGWRGLPYLRSARRVFQSPGPLYEPQGGTGDAWRLGRALFAAGFRAGDLVHNSFSYHLTPAGFMMEEGAFALGCTVFPGGVGNTDLQLAAMADLRPCGYCGTPGFLKTLIETAVGRGAGVSFLERALFSGEAFPPSLRTWMRGHGVEGLQCYATADLGLIAYETPACEGMVLDENVIVEIVRPGTGDPVPEGEVGEVVVTSLDPNYPLIRFGTGDLSAVLPGHCPTGRTNIRIRGWMGRADQTTKVRGMFVTPAQVAQVLQRHPVVGRARLVVEGRIGDERMVLHAEAAAAQDGGNAGATLAESLVASLREVTKLRGEARLVVPGSLPADGKVIEDLRDYS
ncbi:AMP-binding protein [Ramlibacter sp. AN1015]|uniref:phenylacetate--CoA ligase family protein n=1 Tax=Ramlibacter sp. AN1015 TaxID=3133428 RepID=UPI0030C3FEE3